MKWFIFIFLNALISVTSAFSVQKIKAVEGFVRILKHDSNGNIYMVADVASQTQPILYKLSASKELIWTINLPVYISSVAEMYVTSENDIYLDLLQSVENSHKVAVVRSNSTNIRFVEAFMLSFCFFMDNNDNLFYNTKEGVTVLRRNSTDPALIKNLKYYVRSNEQLAYDEFGNVYIGAEEELGIITRESLQEEVPRADIIRNPERTQAIESLLCDEENNLWINIEDIVTDQGIVKKLRNGTLDSITVDNGHKDLKMISAKDRMFIIAGEKLSIPPFLRSALYYITLDNEIVEIQELHNSTFDYRVTEGVVDSEGHSYFFILNEPSLVPELGPMILFKPEETNPISIEIEGFDQKISSVKLDFNDDVWIMTKSDIGNEGGFHYLKKGETFAERVTIQGTGSTSCEKFGVLDYFINSVTKEIYVSCQDGFYLLLAK